MEAESRVCRVSKISLQLFLEEKDTEAAAAEHITSSQAHGSFFGSLESSKK